MYVFGTWNAFVLSVVFNSRDRGRDLYFESRIVYSKDMLPTFV